MDILKIRENVDTKRGQDHVRTQQEQNHLQAREDSEETRPAYALT